MDLTARLLSFERESQYQTGVADFKLRERVHLPLSVRRARFYSLVKYLWEQAGWGEFPYTDEGYERLVEPTLFDGFDYIEISQGDADWLGDLYETVLTVEERRPRGQFRTPPDISRFMVEWSVRAPTDHVLDPAVGTGVFVIESLKRLNELGARTIIGQVLGVDVDPLMVAISAFNIRRKFSRDSHRLICCNFLAMPPSPDFDAVVCNPPYIRHHELVPEEKEALCRRMEAEAGVQLSRLSNTYVYFFIHAYQFLRDGGRMAFITPAEFLNAGYGVGLKQFLLQSCKIVAFILFPQESPVMDALTSSCITLLEKSEFELNHRVKFARVERMENSCALWDALETGANEVPQIALQPNSRWAAHFPSAIRISKGVVNGMKLIPLGEIAAVDRGIATGANAFFTLSDADVERWGIEREYLRPVITHAQMAPLLEFTEADFERLRREGKKVWLLYCDEPKKNLVGKRILRYIEYGEAMGYHKRYLTSHRNPWYAPERRPPAPILATCFARKAMRFIYNRAGVLNLTAFHCVYPCDEVVNDELKLKALLGYLNSRASQLRSSDNGRLYGGGLFKMEPGELETVLVPDVRRISRSHLVKLAQQFDKMVAAQRR